MERMWAYYKSDGFMWFRVFGKGIHIKDISKHGSTFSERYGYRKSLRLGKWRMSLLR